MKQDKIKEGDLVVRKEGGRKHAEVVEVGREGAVRIYPKLQGFGWWHRHDLRIVKHSDKAKGENDDG